MKKTEPSPSWISFTLALSSRHVQKSVSQIVSFCFSIYFLLYVYGEPQLAVLRDCSWHCAFRSLSIVPGDQASCMQNRSSVIWTLSWHSSWSFGWKCLLSWSSTTDLKGSDSSHFSLWGNCGFAVNSWQRDDQRPCWRLKKTKLLRSETCLSRVVS